MLFLTVSRYLGSLEKSIIKFVDFEYPQLYQRNKLIIVVKLTKGDHVTIKISSMVSLQYNGAISRSYNFLTALFGRLRLYKFEIMASKINK